MAASIQFHVGNKCYFIIDGKRMHGEIASLNVEPGVHSVSVIVITLDTLTLSLSLSLSLSFQVIVRGKNERSVQLKNCKEVYHVVFQVEDSSERYHPDNSVHN